MDWSIANKIKNIHQDELLAKYPQIVSISVQFLNNREPVIVVGMNDNFPGIFPCQLTWENYTIDVLVRKESEIYAEFEI